MRFVVLSACRDEREEVCAMAEELLDAKIGAMTEDLLDAQALRKM